jgi:hypothetical protein
MLSKRIILALCIVIAVAAHLGFLALAPHVVMLSANASARDVFMRFNITLRDMEAMQPRAGDPGPGILASRPGSVQDMLAWREDTLAPGEDSQDFSVEVPALNDRVAADRIPRDYDLDRDDDFARRVDAKILEISRDAARRDIEVVRRLARPTGSRILEKDEFPVLQVAEASEEDPLLRFDAPVRSLLAEAVGRGTGDSDTPAGLDPGRPPFEPDAVPIEPIAPDMTPRPPDEIIALAPLRRDTQSARQESPYTFLDDLVDIRLDTFLPPGESLGYFRLRILPRQDSTIEALPKDVFFVIDTSRSIQERKLRLTLRGVQQALEQLRPEDRFNIIAFRDTPSLFRPMPVHATDEMIQDAKRFLDSLESRGETDVYNALSPIVETQPRPGLPGIVIVISDGRPTIGLRDSRAIINGIATDNRLKNSIFAFGGGRTVNRDLLDLLAYRNKGEAHVVDNIDTMNTEFPRFFARFREPLLVDLRANYGRIDQSQVFPSVLPDFYRDRPITVYGRFDPGRDEEFFMRLTGRASGQNKELIFRTQLKQAETGDQSIAQNWAFQRAYYLIGIIAVEGESPERLAELNNLSRKYNIRTSYDE